MRNVSPLLTELLVQNKQQHQLLQSEAVDRSSIKSEHYTEINTMMTLTVFKTLSPHCLIYLASRPSYSMLGFLSLLYNLGLIIYKSQSSS